MQTTLPKILTNASSISKHTGIYSYLQGLFNALPADQTTFDFTFRVPWFRNKLIGKERQYLLSVPPFDNYTLSHQKFAIWYFPFQNFEWKYFEKVRMDNMVLTVHDINFYYEQDHASKAFHKAKDDILRKTDRAKKIIAISEFTKSDLVSKLGINPDKISVIHNGYSMQEFPEFNPTRYKPQKEFIFSLGSRRNKNIHTLPAMLLGNEDELVLGRLRPYSSYGKEVLNIAKSLGVSDRVKIIGHISDEEKYWYFKNCKAFAFPSKAEGFGLPVLEAMHFGKPVFLSKYTSLPEVGGKEAFYFDNFEAENMGLFYQSAMQNFYQGPQKKEQIQAWAQSFSWDRAARKLLKVFEEVLSS